MSVEEMVAMKNDVRFLSYCLGEVFQEILWGRHEEQCKIDIRFKIMVVIINCQVPVLEILEIKDKLTMNEIMSLQVTFPFKSFEEVFLPNY